MPPCDICACGSTSDKTHKPGVERNRKFNMKVTTEKRTKIENIHIP
jgi:hypothetical protein